jgi:hypothetical protein
MWYFHICGWLLLTLFFTQNLGEGNALFIELNVAMSAIELAASKGYWNVWLETDSKLILQAFQSYTMVPWNLRNRWYNCLLVTHNMRFMVSHVYREGNVCADGLDNFGLTLVSLDLFWFNRLVMSCKM